MEEPTAKINNKIKRKVIPMTQINLHSKWILLQAILGDAELSPTDKVVAAAMLGNLNTVTGRCDPSAGNIASRIKRSVNTVSASRQHLLDHGWLRATRRQRMGL